MAAKIPKILHFIWLASGLDQKPWSLVHHVCLKSAAERIMPDEIFFYYDNEPRGSWWSLSRSLVTPVEIKAPRQIFGHPLRHVAHRADVVRLQKLIEHGGIYLDADVLVQRSFDDLLDHSTVLGEEGANGQWGLGNAVILAEPQSPFLHRWLDEYRSFRGTGRRGDESWAEHSVALPLKLARAYPQEVTVLPYTAFYWPLWTKDHTDWIYAPDRPAVPGGAYANHLWEGRGWQYLEDLTPGRVRSIDSNFHIWARPLIADLPDDYGALSIGGRLRKVRSSTIMRAYELSWEAGHFATRARRRLRRLIAG